MQWAKNFKRFRYTFGYFIIVALVLIALNLSLDNQDRIEKTSLAGAAVNCETINETRAIINEILSTIAQPRPDDTPEQAAERIEFIRQFDELLEPKDCPPIPR